MWRGPWTSRADCPKNMVQARERGEPATVEIDAAFRAGLAGLSAHSHAILLYWMHQARRDLIVQAPRHRRLQRPGVVGPDLVQQTQRRVGVGGSWAEAK